MRGEFKGFFIMKQIYNEALAELFPTTSRVYPLHFFRSTTLAAFGHDSVTTEESTVKGRLIC